MKLKDAQIGLQAAALDEQNHNQIILISILI